MSDLHERKTGFILLGLIGFLGGCAAVEPPTEPPPAVLRVDVGFPSSGTRWVTRTLNQDGSTSTTTFTVLAEDFHEGKPVYRLQSGRDIRVYDKATRNWISTLRDRNERFQAAPHDGTFSWPLWVGKWWRASYTYYDHVQGRSWSPVDFTWTVEAYEEMKVPAGTFKAFRLQSSPGRNAASFTTIWYAPEIKLIVKQVYERTTGHNLGPGKFVTELIEYHSR